MKDYNFDNINIDINIFTQSEKCDCTCDCNFINIDQNKVTIDKSCNYHSRKSFCENEHFVPIFFGINLPFEGKFDREILFNKLNIELTNNSLNSLDKIYLLKKIEYLIKQNNSDSGLKEAFQIINNFEFKTQEQDLSYNSILDLANKPLSIDVNEQIKKIKSQIINSIKTENSFYFTLTDKVISLQLLEELIKLNYKLAIYNNKIIILLREFSIHNQDDKTLLSFILDKNSNLQSSKIEVSIINDIYGLTAIKNLGSVLI